MSPRRRTPIRHEFVELMPRPLEEGVLYVSITHRLALHRCFCGCGFEVATPLAPHEWRLGFDGETVSLHPSVGVWGLECQSHYWVKRDQVIWDKPMSKEKIERLRRREREEVEGPSETKSKKKTERLRGAKREEAKSHSETTVEEDARAENVGGFRRFRRRLRRG